MSSVALTEQARRDATKKTTMRLKLSKVGGANLSRERITPWLGPLREACQQARRTTPASSDHCDSRDSRHAVFLLSESQTTSSVPSTPQPPHPHYTNRPNSRPPGHARL